MGTVLVLEDEPSVLAVISAVLRKTGWTVLSAETAEDAIRIAQEYPGRIGLLVADVILRNRNGPEIAAQLLKIHPEMSCLFVSGYPREQLDHAHLLDNLALGQRVAFLPKPFSPAELRALAAALEQRDGADACSSEQVVAVASASARARYECFRAKIAGGMTLVEIGRTAARTGSPEHAASALRRAQDVLDSVMRGIDDPCWTVAEHSALRTAASELSLALASKRGQGA